MTPDRLRACLDALNWRTAELAARTHVSPVTARRWQSGKRPVPEQVAAAIEAMANAAMRLSGKTSDEVSNRRRFISETGEER